MGESTWKRERDWWGRVPGRGRGTGEGEYLEEGEGLVESRRHDDLGRGVELNGGQLVAAGTGRVGMETLLDLSSPIRDTQTTHSQEVKT